MKSKGGKSANQYLYIVQFSLEVATCKIGITDNLERRLKEYENTTGKSIDNIPKYLFTCEVKNMKQLEGDIKNKYLHLRQNPKKETYFYNEVLFESYVDFISSHKAFIKAISIKPKDKKQVIQIVKKTTPTLQDRGLTRKAVLQKAQKINNDEFYTRYEDVEKEASMYPKSIWKNKVVFCNCDDAVGDTDKNISPFALYFIKHFQELELKKLICTHYSGIVDLFNEGAKGYIFTKDGFNEVRDFPAGYNGSFDDPISLKILKEEADIVCTNPPFSRAIDYWKIIVESGKHFLIISNIANPITKAYIPYFKANKVWGGYNEIDWFLNPKRELVRASGYWYCNLSIKNRPKYKQLKIIALKDIPAQYKKYDDFKVLLVDNGYIPNDYKKPFAISTRPILNGLLEKGYKIIEKDESYIAVVNGKQCFRRVLVKKI